MNFHIARKVIFGGAAALTLSSMVSGAVLAQTSDANAETYSALLQQISDVKMATAQKEVYIATQKEKIASLRAQIAAVPATKEAVGPMLDKMAVAIEGEMNSDFPFKAGERFARLDDFRTSLSDKEATPGEKMRKALNIYDFEVGYGNSVSAYAGDNPKNPGTRLAACEADELSATCGLSDAQKKNMGYDKDGNKSDGGATVKDLADGLKDGAYLHYGRLAFVYLQHDSSEAWRYDKDAKDWVQLSGADVLNVRRAVRIARGESAPGVVTAPLTLTE